jgi:selenocysteine-specific elongation factor
MLADAPEPDRGGRPRLHVDRVFSIRGSGTVVTGTLTGGPIATGDEIELLPSGTRARIRGLQTHHRGVRTAAPVSRVAVNLTADRRRIARGEVLAPAGVWTATSVLEARIEPVRSLDHPITSRGAFKLHAGAAERNARIRLYDDRQVSAEGAFVRITLSEPLVLDVGDRFVLRESGRRRTIAGGIVLDTDPPHRAGTAAGQRLGARARVSRADLPALLVAERRAVRSDDVRSILGTTPDVIEGAVRLGGWWVQRPLSDGIGAAITARLAALHAEEPAAAGESIATTRRSIADAFAAAGAPHDLELADAVVDRLESEGTLVREGALVRLASHRAGSDDEVAGVVEVVRSAEPTPPSIAELRAAGVANAVVEAAVRSGALVRISPELVFTRELVERAGAIVREAGADGITLSAFREGLGTSRKYAVPLAEHLDRSGVTRRSGDLRFARGATGASGRSPAQPS